MAPQSEEAAAVAAASSGAGAGAGGAGGLRQRPKQHASSSLLQAAGAREGSSPPPPPPSSPRKGGAALAAVEGRGGGRIPGGAAAAAAPPSGAGAAAAGGGGGDRWTGLLAALWGLLFLALCVNKQELWVVLAGLVGYACLCFLLDVVAIPPIWDGPWKAAQTARLSNGLVGIAHAIAMGLAAALGASRIIKLTMTCGFLLFDLWDKAWKRLYTSPPYRYTRGVPYAMQGATTLVLSITAICKGIDLDADLLVAVPAVHALFESVHDLVTLFSSAPSSLLTTASKLAELVTLLPFRLLPHAALLGTHLLRLHAPERVLRPLGIVAPVEGVMTTWWASRVTTTLLLMLNAANLATLAWPALMRQRQQRQLQQRRMLYDGQEEGKEEKNGGEVDVDPSRLWFVHGRAYALEEFAARHPGGAQALNLGKGRDCTAMFESYHPFTERHKLVLDKYRVSVPPAVLAQHVVVPTPTTPEGQEGKTAAAASFPLTTTPSPEGQEGEAGVSGEAWPPRDAFYEVLKARAAEAMAGREVVASSARRLYYACVAATVAATYYYGYLQGSWPLLLLFALSSWLLGAAGHDGSHFACSHRPWVNALCGLGISLIASPFLWYHQHTFGHHSFTNDHEHDPDLHHFVLTRLHANQPHGPQHKLQRFKLYVLLQYAVVVFGETIWIPLKLLLFRTLHGVLAIPMNAAARLGALAHLVLYFFLVFYVPAHSSALAGTRKVWLFPLIYVSICGMLFGIFSQINHLNHASIESAGQARKQQQDDASGDTDQQQQQQKKPYSWAAEQVETSANFATHSPFWFVLSNGLNFQIEHHLFPGINHEHLWRIQPAVIQTCREFGVEYKSYDSMWAIVKETARYYRSLALPSASPSVMP